MARTRANLPAHLHVDSLRPDGRIIAVAAAQLNAGRVVAYPTETFYGLGADARLADALVAVQRLKGRDAGKPLLLLVDSLEMVEPLTAGMPPAIEAVARRLWPGPLTVLLPAADGLHPALTGPGGTVAVRRSSHPVARALVGACRGPVTATSANPAGARPAESARQVVDYFGSRIAAVVDAGPTPGGLPSTLLDLTSAPARIVRAGAMAADRIAAVVRLV